MSISKGFLSQEHRHPSLNPSCQPTLASRPGRRVLLKRGRRVLASPAQFQFSHARSSQCAGVSSSAQLGTRISHSSHLQVTFVPSKAQTASAEGSGPRGIKAPRWGGSPGHRHPDSHTHRRRGDRCPGPSSPAAHERPPPRAPPVGPTRAHPAADAPPGF